MTAFRRNTTASPWPRCATRSAAPAACASVRTCIRRCAAATTRKYSTARPAPASSILEPAAIRRSARLGCHRTHQPLQCVPQSKIPPPRSARKRATLDLHSPAPPSGVYIANIDGASRGNPGPAAYAVVLRDPEGKIVLELGKKIGRETNNVAEYYALLAALDYAMNQDIRALRIRSDSELLVRQMQGRYKVKSPDLKPLYERALKQARQIPYFAIEHVRRELNSEADAPGQHRARFRRSFPFRAESRNRPRRKRKNRRSRSLARSTRPHLPQLGRRFRFSFARSRARIERRSGPGGAA